MGMAKLKHIFDTTFSHHWHGNARELVELRSSRWWLSFFGAEAPVKKITLASLDRAIKVLQDKGNKASTINSKLSCLRVALEFTRKRGMHNVGVNVPRLKHSSDERTEYFSEEEQADVEAAIGDDAFRALFVWSIETGLRPSESARLTKKDIRFDLVLGWTVIVRESKNGDPRVVPLTRKAVNAWESVSTFQPYKAHVISKHWARLRRAAPDAAGTFVFYTCRHTCATRLLSRGVNIKVVQSWMGHRDISMTLRYAKLIPQDLAQARDLIEA